MANGQPKPAFYVSVLLVVLGLVGLALWRYGALPGGGQAGNISNEELKQMKGGAEAPDSSGITTVKEYKFRPAERLPAVTGTAAYKPLKTIDLALVYKNEKVQNGTNTISGADANGNYTIGGANGLRSGHFDEVGFYMQWSF